jgi:hypothetical protein
MTSETKSKYFLFEEGAVQEEPWEWEELEALCRSGRLSPDSLIFMPEENDWKKAADTELAPLFEGLETPGEDTGGEMDPEEMAEAYRNAVEQVEQNPDLLPARLNAAEIAIALDNREAAQAHYQDALNHHPYHPRAVQEAKRNLVPAEWVQLRYLGRPPSIWERIDGVFSYPLARGPLYLVIPALALSALWWLPVTSVLGGTILFLWGIQVLRSSALLEPTPPLWHRLLTEPGEALVRPVILAAVVFLEVYLPFIIFGQMLVSSGASPAPNAFTALQTSPFLTVLIFTITLIYLPAVLVVGMFPDGKVSDAFKPVYVAKAIRIMEKEYLVAAGYMVLMLCLWGFINLGLEKIPIAGRIVATLLGVYAMVTAGLVLGRLQARFKEQMGD